MMPAVHKTPITKIVLLWVIASLMLASCGVQSGPTPETSVPENPSPTAAPSATLTPVLDTPTPAPTATEVLVSPTPAPTIPVPTEQIRILILGSDIREDNSFRTDVIMLLTVNPQEGTASVLSFPRDLYVYLPFGRFERINTVQYFGFKTMADTLESNFGVRPQYYVMTNFAGFQNIIDSLGGIDVQVAVEMTDQCDLPHRDVVTGACTVKPGTVRMDGQYALWYVRSRKSTSDFDRQRRAQEVMRGIFARLLTLDALARAPEIYRQFSGSVETNLDLRTIMSLGGVIPSLTRDGSIRRYAITVKEATPFIGAEGASLLYPNLAAIQAIVREALTP